MVLLESRIQSKYLVGYIVESFIKTKPTNKKKLRTRMLRMCKKLRIKETKDQLHVNICQKLLFLYQLTVSSSFMALKNYFEMHWNVDAESLESLKTFFVLSKHVPI